MGRATALLGAPLRPGRARPRSRLQDRLVIFDCDGVLVDSERIAIGVDREILARLGWDLSEAEIIERFVGRSDAAITTAVEAQLGIALTRGWEGEFTPLYRAACEAGLQPVDGIVDALDAIEMPTCVASSGTHDKMRFSLGLTGLWGRFAGRIFSATEVARGKPAPDLFLHAARTMGVRPEQCVVVEDSRQGVLAALAAGMRTRSRTLSAAPSPSEGREGSAGTHRGESPPAAARRRTSDPGGSSR